MATDYVKLLAKLKLSLSTAISNQEYHRLMELDAAVRACVSEAIGSCVGDDTAKAAIADQIKELMAVYRQVSLACTEKSAGLKKELQQLNQSKQGANRYLQVAGKFGY